MGQKKHYGKILDIDADSPDIWEFMAPFFCVGCSSVLVRLHGTVRPASCIRMVVQAPHDRLKIMSCAMPWFKGEESQQRLHVVLSTGEYVQCIHSLLH